MSYHQGATTKKTLKNASGAYMFSMKLFSPDPGRKGYFLAPPGQSPFLKANIRKISKEEKKKGLKFMSNKAV